MQLIFSIKNQARIRDVLFTIVVFMIFLGGFTWLQFSFPDLAGTDGYYHIKMAWVMRKEGLVPDFPWLPLTILNAREFYDHHFLFHVALIPFTFGDLIQGAKWASALFAALAFTVLWIVLRTQKVAFAFLWALALFAVSSAFLYRLCLPRAQSWSLAFLGLGMLLLFQRAYFWLLPLSFVYAWSYDGFPLIIGLVLIYTLAVGLLEKHWLYLPLAYACLGILLGLMLNPYFPHDLVFVWRHLLPKLSGATEIRVGNEWYAYRTDTLMANSSFSFILFAAGVVALGLNRERMDVRTATALGMTFMFGIMLFQARRFVEYFPAFSLLFAAFAFHPLLSKGIASHEDKVQPRISRLSASWQRRSIRYWGMGILFALMIFAFGRFTLQQTQESLRDSKPYDLYAQASAWLQANSAPGERVFQTDWDDFTRLFFYNTHNTYLVGLDPTYLQLYDAELYDLWVNVTQGRVINIAEVVYTHFGSRWIFTDIHHDAFISMAEADAKLEKVYQDDQAIIFHVVEENP